MKKSLLLFVLAFLGTVNANAQLDQLLNKVVSTVTGQDKVSEGNLVGTWTFSGSGIEFTSDKSNVLKELGSTAASQQIEKKLDKYLAKVGITPGRFTITFAEDGTLTVKTANGRTHEGTYQVADGSVVIKIGKTGKGFNCQTEITNKTLKLMVKADKLMSLASSLANMSGNSSLKTIDSLLKNYQGLNAGLQFTR